MALCLWYLVKRDLYRVRYCTVAYTRYQKTRACLFVRFVPGGHAKDHFCLPVLVWHRSCPWSSLQQLHLLPPALYLQGDQLYMAVCFWYLENRGLSSVCYFTAAYTIASLFASTRTTRSCSSGRVVLGKTNNNHWTNHHEKVTNILGVSVEVIAIVFLVLVAASEIRLVW